MLSKLSYPAATMGDWYQDPSQTPTPLNAQVPLVEWHKAFTYNLRKPSRTLQVIIGLFVIPNTTEMLCKRLLHCLQNNDKKKSLYMFITDAIFPQIFLICGSLNLQMEPRLTVYDYEFDYRGQPKRGFRHLPINFPILDYTTENIWEHREKYAANKLHKKCLLGTHKLQLLVCYELHSIYDIFFLHYTFIK